MIVVLVGIGALVTRARLPLAVKTLVLAGLGLRVVGALARMQVAADSWVYLQWGERYAEYFARLDFSPLVDPSLWRTAQWVGTNAVAYPAGFAIVLLGPTRFGVFLVYTLLAFIGVAAYGLAFRRSLPAADTTSYWAWLMLFPSLVFWPSSLGKEALMILGLGIAAFGFLGREERANWAVVALGVAVVFAIRPQVAAIVVLAMAMSYVLRPQNLGPLRVLESLAILAVGLFVMANLLEPEVGDASLASVEGYVEYNSAMTAQGDSEVGAAGFGLASIPLAILNVLFRPFPWEAHNLSSLISALEVVLMWGLIYWKRRQVMAALRNWRHSRLLRFALLFTLLYVIGLGMNIGNLGIIARQRVLVFPLLFAFVEAGAMYLPRQTAAAYPVRQRHGGRAYPSLYPS